VSSLNSAIKKISEFSSLTRFAIGRGRTQANLGTIKATLAIKGIIKNNSLATPLESLTNQEKMNLKKALEENNLI
jgi:dihydrodipicolinate synthase/N-acetylneuraminate lyase